MSAGRHGFPRAMKEFGVPGTAVAVVDAAYESLGAGRATEVDWRDE